MSETVNNLLAADHSELDELLAELLAAFETENLEQIYNSLDMFWARLAMHIRGEHLHLFPAIIKAVETQATGNGPIPSLVKAQNAINDLQDDHNFFMRELLAAVKQLRDLFNGDQTDVVKRLRKVRETVINVKNRLEIHNELEETEVYDWADSLLQTAERIALNEKMKKELDNLPPRFKRSG